MMALSRDGRPGPNELGLAEVEYLQGEVRILKPGRFVLCAVSGRRIPLSELTFWNVDRQEAYATAEYAFQRSEQNRKAET